MPRSRVGGAALSSGAPLPYFGRDEDQPMTETIETPPLPTLEEMQHWTWVMGRAQQMMMVHVAKAMGEAPKIEPAALAGQWPAMNPFADPAKLARQQMEMWSEGPVDLATGAGRA
jgi:polyhydroxyalkanoate synthase